MDMDDLRRYYAEEIRAVANIQTEAIIAAFAKVRREGFLGPGPWQIVNPDSWQTMSPGAQGGGSYRATPDADPRHLYHNILIAIDASRNLNNGQPASLAMWIDALELQPGQSVLHIGCGVGYYTAIMAEVVGPSGHVLGVEIDSELAARARKNLSHLNQAEVVTASGAEFDSGPRDAIFINAGATGPQRVWLDNLRPGGRLLLPLTFSRDENSSGGGFMLRVVHEADGYAARFISPVAIFPCVGARDVAANQHLREAMSKGTWMTVRSLRREEHEASATCWLHGEDFCLSTLGVGGASS